MTSEKSEAVIVPKKKGNAFGRKDCRIMNFQRREMHEWTRSTESAYTKLQRIADLARKAALMKRMDYREPDALIGQVRF